MSVMEPCAARLLENLGSTMWVQFATQCGGAWLGVYSRPEFSSEVLHGLSHLIFPMALEVSFIFFFLFCKGRKPKLKRVDSITPWVEIWVSNPEGICLQCLFLHSLKDF